MTHHTPRTSEDAGQDMPSTARIYDCLLGGYHNFEADRQVVHRLLEKYPDLPIIAKLHRRFLRRAVQFLLSQGIDQFLDIGSGLPTTGHVHQVAEAAGVPARVVYVDKDPVAVAHSQAILANSPYAVSIECDVRNPDCILSHRQVRELLDFRRPIGLLMIALLHYVPEDEAAHNAVRQLVAALAPGSYLVVAHTSLETVTLDPERRALYGPIGAVKHRSYAQVSSFFEGLEWVEPGLVYTPQWRPEQADDPMLDRPWCAYTWAGVARKPG